MRKIFLALSILCFISATAQNSNTLLWRITKPGQAKPSYLYGTMHLTDKKVFQLGDSVYKAMEQTQGFAAELDINRLGGQMINHMMAEKEEKESKEPEKVKDKVSPETWETYKDLLAKKFNKRADKVTVNDLEDMDTRLNIDMFRKGDMPTFLDAWLFGQAKKMGKWVGGIEDVEDQFSIEDDIEDKIQSAVYEDDYFRNGFENLLKIYTEQRLDSIESLYNSQKGRDLILLKRNVKMARRIDSLNSLRPTLFAVGVAHLPGDTGLIDLLRKRGFTVTPVFSSKKISPEKFVLKQVEIPWVPVEIKDSAYALNMPGVSDIFKMYEQMGLDMKIYFDLSAMKMYMTISAELSPERVKVGTDSLFNSLTSRYAAAGIVSAKKTITINGTEGREFHVSIPEGDMIMQIFLPQMERVVINAVYGFSEKNLYDNDAKKFFQSFVVNKNIHVTPVTSPNWSSISNDKLGFSMDMPGKPKITRDLSGEGKILDTYQSYDLRSQLICFATINSMKEGMYNNNHDTTYFSSIKDGLLSRFEDGKLIDSMYLPMKGYPAFRFTIRGKSEGTLIELASLAVIRGNRTYYLFTVFEPNDNNRQNSDQFLNSFKLVPYSYGAPKAITSPDHSFTSTSRFNMKELEIEDDNSVLGVEKRFILYDTLSTASIIVSKIPLPSWFWYESDTAFLRARANAYRTYLDSVVDYNVSTDGRSWQSNFVLERDGHHMITRIKMLLTGDKIYEIRCNYPKLENDTYDDFYRNFQLIDPAPLKSRYASRGTELAAFLASCTKVQASAVKDFWPYIRFSKDDLPELYRMSLKLYPDFDSSYYNNLNRSIFDKIALLDSSGGMMEYIRENYKSVGSENEYIRPFVVGYLSREKTAASYDLLKKCLLEYPYNIDKNRYFSHGLYDSIKLTARLFPEMMKLSASNGLWELTSHLARYLLDSGELEKSQVKTYGKYLIERARKELLAKDEIEGDPYSYTDLIRLIGMVNSPEGIAVLRQFAKMNHREIKLSTQVALMESGQAPDSRTIYTLAMTDEKRYDLYEEMRRLNKLSLFPKEYLSQKLLGASKLYARGYDEEEEPLSVTFVAEKLFTYKGKSQKFYLYQVKTLEGEDGYLGVAGPFDVNPKVYTSDHSATGIHYEKTFKASELDNLFKAYMESLDGNNEGVKDSLPPPPMESKD